MSAHYKRYLLLAALATLMAVLAIQTHTVAAAAPPANDSFAFAQSIVLNTSIKTKNVDLATTESGEPACGGIGAFSVWYRFVAPFSGTIALSTAGSYIQQGWFVDTVMCVYTGAALNALVLVASNDDYSAYYAEIPAVSITKGVTYHVKVAQFSSGNQFPGSYYRVTTTVLESNSSLLEDGGFETYPLGSPWKFKNAFNGDGRVCGDGNALLGACSVKFVGGLDEATTLQQKYVWPIDQIKAKTTHYLAALVYTKALVGTAEYELGLKIKYSDGTPTTKYSYVVWHLNLDYLSMLMPVLFASPNVSSVTMFLKFRSESGVMHVDEMLLFYAGGLLRDTPAGVLPVPLPAQ